MLFPIIKVKSKGSDRSHIVGTNSHDVLYVEEDGSLHYLNVQCMVGTKDGEFAFDAEVPPDDMIDYTFTGRPEIEFVDFDALLSMMTDHLNEAMKAKIESYRVLRKHWDEELEKAKSETGIKGDTSGLLP